MSFRIASATIGESQAARAGLWGNPRAPTPPLPAPIVFAKFRLNPLGPPTSNQTSWMSLRPLPDVTMEVVMTTMVET